MKYSRSQSSGVTLLEILLVLAIIGSLSVILTNLLQQGFNTLKLNRAAAQMQQILDAGVTYYVNNTSWPTTGTTASPEVLSATSTLVTQNYLSQVPVNPWGGSYSISVTTQNNINVFQVTITLKTSGEAYLLAGRLPLAEVSGTSVVAQAIVPGMSLSNANAVNYGAIYNSGACVPAPECPAGSSPQIVVTPAAVAGVYDTPTCTDGTDSSTCSNGASGSPNSVPIHGFTALAIGDPNNPSLPLDVSTGTIVNCNGNGADQCESTQTSSVTYQCPTSYTFTDTSGHQETVASVATTVVGGGTTCCPIGGYIATSMTRCTNFSIPSGQPFRATNTANVVAIPSVDPTYIDTGKYWRVCLYVTTSKGLVSPTLSSWGQLMGKVVVLTRCAPTNEPQGSGFNVFTP